MNQAYKVMLWGFNVGTKVSTISPTVDTNYGAAVTSGLIGFIFNRMR